MFYSDVYLNYSRGSACSRKSKSFLTASESNHMSRHSSTSVEDEENLGCLWLENNDERRGGGSFCGLPACLLFFGHKDAKFQQNSQHFLKFLQHSISSYQIFHFRQFRKKSEKIRENLTKNQRLWWKINELCKKFEILKNHSFFFSKLISTLREFWQNPWKSKLSNLVDLENAEICA